MLPNFLVIGAAKSATSRLCVLLGRHPDVFLCEPKEPHFFARDEVFANGMNWYEGLFEGAAGKKAVGEGSTTYTKLPLHPQSAERIARHLPDARLIYIVRHPIDRIESDYIEALKGGYAVGADFNKALREFPHFVESSCYWKQISAYRRLFPDERILVLFFEDFNADPASVLRRCFVFLGVDPSVNLGPLNERPTSPKVLTPTTTFGPRSSARRGCVQRCGASSASCPSACATASCAAA